MGVIRGAAFSPTGHCSDKKVPTGGLEPCTKRQIARFSPVRLRKRQTGIKQGLIPEEFALSVCHSG